MIRTARRALALLPALLIASPAAALAAPATVPVSPRTIDAAPVALAFDASGRAVASWRGLTGANPDAARDFNAFATTRRDGTWRAPQWLSRTVIAQDLAMTGGRTAALATLSELPLTRHRTRSQIAVTLIDTVSGRPWRVVPVARGVAQRVTYEGPPPTLGAPRIAATPDGGLLVAWQRTLPKGEAGVWAIELRPGGRAGRARRLGPRGGAPVFALGQDGSGALLTWQHGRRLEARVHYPAGGWGPIEIAAVQAAERFTALEYLSAAATSTDRIAIGAVVTQRTGAGVRVRPLAVVRGPGAHWTTSTLSDFTYAPTGATSYVTGHLRVLVLATADGRLQAVWPDLLGGRVRAVTASIDPGPGAPVALSPEGVDVALEDAAAAGPGGGFAVTWFDTSVGGGTPGLAEVDAAGGVRATAGFAAERALFGAQVAYSPAGNRPTVLWSEGSSSSGYHLVAWRSP